MISALLRELVVASRLVGRHPEIGAILAEAGLGTGCCPLWGLATVTADARFYEPAPEGRLAVITGVYEENHLIDLVATSLHTRALRTRRGEARILGSDAIDRARESGRPLDLFADGWSWLRHGSRGAVVLDWRIAPYLLADLPAISCETPRLAGRLKRAFERPIALPDIVVLHPKETRHAA